MRVSLTTAALALVLVASPPAPSAEELKLSVDASVDVLSGYIWRGFVLGADDALVLQPGLGLGFGESGLSLGIWGSFFAMDRRAPKSTDLADELDFTLDYTRTVGQVDASVGYTHYTFPSVTSPLPTHTKEFYGALSAGGPVAPSVGVYYDFGAADAFYVTAGVAPELPLNEDGSVTLALSGTAAAYLSNGVRGNHFGHFTVTAGIGIPAGALTITPKAGYIYSDDKVNPDNSSFYGGVGISWSK